MMILEFVWHLYLTHPCQWIGIICLALRKLMANTVLKKCCRDYYLIGQRSFSPGTAYPCKIFLSNRTNYSSVNGTLVEAQRDSARKWLLLLSNSWTDMTELYCCLITMINHSAYFTSNPFISNQCFSSILLLQVDIKHPYLKTES